MRRFEWRMRHVLRESRTMLHEVLQRRKEWRKYWNSLDAYCSMQGVDEQVRLDDLHPVLGEDTAVTPIEPTYFYQDAWAFGRIIASRPQWHLDVGSHHKFVSLLSRIVDVTMVDLRPLSLSIGGLQFRHGSITDLPWEDGTVGSVSSLCVIEHIGLGRYGDALDPHGSEKALAELKRVVAPGGHLYISVPLDDCNRTYFNAHRAFEEEYLLSLIEPFQILDKQYIQGDSFMSSKGMGFGTGCYHLRRL